jgi:exosortase A
MDLPVKKHALPFLGVLVLFMAISLLNIPIIKSLWQYSFDDGTYSHAYLIPFIVAYLFYDLSISKKLIFRDTVSWFALGLLLFSAYFLFVTSTAQISLGYWLAILMLFCGAINFLFKPSVKLFFPAIYFIFLIPLWGLLTIPLQSLSVIAVNTLMSLTSIPVFVEQQFVHIPSGVFEIADGCSGLRYLLTSLAISSLYIFLYLRNTKNIIIFASITIFGALLTNWIRIAILIIIGHQTEMTSDLMTDHNMFGWYVYAPFMLLLFKLGGYLADKEDNKQITSDNSAKIQLNYPSWPLALLLFITLLFSSTSLQMSATTVPEKNLIDMLVQPIIYNASTVEVINNSSTKTQLIYSFNESNLESKPTFFENDFIPKNWLIVSNMINNEDRVIKIKNGLKTAIITISYEISGLKIGSSSQFKLERLKQAMFGKTKTKLHWQFKLD